MSKKIKKISTLLIVSFAVVISGFSQNKYQSPALDNPESWSVIFIPDIQNYVKFGRNQAILHLMMTWIEDNIDSLNIKMVLCPGDLVEQNDRINRGVSGDQSSLRQWQCAARSFGILDGKVPYIAATGNHDYTYDIEGNKKSHYNEYFTIDKNFLNRNIICQNTLNSEGDESLENAAFEIITHQGDKYLFMTIEFAPRDTVVSWAQNVAQLEQYKDHRIVLLTHAYLNAKSKRTSGDTKVTCYNPYLVDGDITKRKQLLMDANNGEDLWKKLIKPSSNIELVLCGHISGEGFRQDKNHIGKTVNQMLFDAQSKGGGHYGNGGDGWLRILEFYPDKRTVKVKTFSPLFAISPSTWHLAWDKSSANEFIFQFDGE